MGQSAPRPWTTLTIVALTVTAYFLPHVVSILLLLFAGTVLAVLLDAITGAAQRLLPGGRAVGLLGMMLTVALAFAAMGLLVVPPLMTQVPELADRLPAAWSTLAARLREQAVLQPLLAQVGSPSQWFQGGGLLGRVSGIISGTFDVLFNAFVIVFVGIYLTVSPESHQRVAVYPLRPERQGEARALFAELGRELRLWLAGRAVSMAIVGLATGAGLWLLGVRLAFTLGLLAGLLSFVPYLGPVLAMLPALLIAFADSAQLAGTVLLVYAAIQVLESYLITPLVQQRATAIPPALLIAAQLLGGVFGGMLGVLLAAPLAVAGATAVRRIYIEPRNAETTGEAA